MALIGRRNVMALSIFRFVKQCTPILPNCAPNYKVHYETCQCITFFVMQLIKAIRAVEIWPRAFAFNNASLHVHYKEMQALQLGYASHNALIPHNATPSCITYYLMPPGKAPPQKNGIHMQEPSICSGLFKLVFDFFWTLQLSKKIPSYHHFPPTYR